jgi:hypothetical protein
MSFERNSNKIITRAGSKKRNVQKHLKVEFAIKKKVFEPTYLVSGR